MWRSTAGALFLSVACLCMGTLAFAQGAKLSSPVEMARQAESLKPGQWVWAPEIAPVGPVLVYVDLSRQLATVYRNGVRIGVSTVSTGKPGHETPTGVFTILQKDANHHSSKYNNAPMLFQERLTWDGVALHAGGLPGYPESHGCIHLPYEFAKALFLITELGGTVIVAGNAAHPVGTDEGQVLAPTTQTPAAPIAADYWAPEKSLWGPVNIIISRADQRAIVLRNGVEIGSTPVTLPSGDTATHVLTMGVNKAGEAHWVYAGVAGHADEKDRELSEAVRNRVHIPPAFYQQVTEILKPGATILVTSAPLNAGSPGQPLTVISATRPAT